MLPSSLSQFSILYFLARLLNRFLPLSFSMKISIGARRKK